jgi:hypothetical protein
MTPGQHVFDLLLAHVGVERIAEAMTAIATDEEHYRPGPTRAERGQRVAKIRADLSELIISEEGLAMTIEGEAADDTIVLRRPDFDAAAAWRLWQSELGRPGAIKKLRTLVGLAAELHDSFSAIHKRREAARQERHLAQNELKKWEAEIERPTGRPIVIHRESDNAVADHLHGRPKREAQKQRERIALLDQTIQELTERIQDGTAERRLLGQYIDRMVKATGFESGEIKQQIAGAI